MDQFVKMDVFFFVTTVVVVLIAILILAILFAVWRVIKNVEKITKEVSEESALLRGDIAEMRSRMRTEGFKMFTLGAFLHKAFKRFTGKSGRRQKSGEESA